jgi:hypothetical protein
MIDLPPQNPLETLLNSAMDGQTSIGGFMKAFVAADVIVLNHRLVTPDGSGFDPLLFAEKGDLFVGVFTDMVRLGVYTQSAPYVGQMKLVEVLKRVPPGHGVVVNPVPEEERKKLPPDAKLLRLNISWAGIQNILKDCADPFRP